ncbi:MAG: hypothetical protein IT376_19300 [Polyangiaceae bacterium]|nr:hypothetical protein [Polyangiaceae bacterium]
MKRRIAQLEDQVTRLRNDADRLEERLAITESGAPRPGAPAAAGASAPREPEGAGDEQRPPLRVVRLEPDGAPAEAPAAEAAPEGEPAEDPAPRPVVRVQGSKLTTRFEGVRPATGEP